MEFRISLVISLSQGYIVQLLLTQLYMYQMSLTGINVPLSFPCNNETWILY